MEIKITPFTCKEDQPEGTLKAGNNVYDGKYHSAGIVTEIRSDDDWPQQEMSWISRSEIPLITALRHSMIEIDERSGRIPLIISFMPYIKRFEIFSETITVDSFPSDDECRQLIRKECDIVADSFYHFIPLKISNDEFVKYYKLIDYKDDVLMRAGSCLYKANILLHTSTVFAEEIYLNAYTALEGIIEHMKGKMKLDNKAVIERIAKKVGFGDFVEYEEEMRDMIRNNIVHPVRHSGEINTTPIYMADSVYENLAYIDWLFKKYILGEL